jgi:hypothetical protein
MPRFASALIQWVNSVARKRSSERHGDWETQEIQVVLLFGIYGKPGAGRSAKPASIISRFLDSGNDQI